MILSDRDLRRTQAEYGLINPYQSKHVQPASIDLTLHGTFLVNGVPVTTVDGYALAPREFVLASTAETVSVPVDLVGKVEGRSTWARRGIIVENAGYIDPGFSGMITLELCNIGPDTVFLPVGDRICQIAYAQLTSPAERPYGSEGLGSHYQGQTGPTPAASQE